MSDELAIEAQVDAAASQELELIHHEMARAFRETVEQLTEDERRALGLLPFLEMAGMPGATLRKRKQRALDRLRALWRIIHGEP